MIPIAAPTTPSDPSDDFILVESSDEEAGGDTLLAEPTDVLDEMAVGDDYDLDELYEDEQEQPEEEDEVEPKQTEW